MFLSQLLSQHEKEFQKLCKKYDVEKIYAFGSSMTEEFNEEKSDIDLLVTISTPDPTIHGENLLSLWNELEFLFKRKVDLLTENSLTNPYLKKSIYSTRKLIYDRQGEKVFV